MKWVTFYLTEKQVSDVEHHAQGELGSEEGEEPLGGVHVRLQVKFLEMGPQVWKLFLYGQIVEKQQQWILQSILHENILTHTLLKKMCIFKKKEQKKKS